MQKAHEPSDKDRKMVHTLSGVGVPQEDICTILGITKPTLHKYYDTEIQKGMAEANAKIAGALFNQAMSGNIAALIFWTKARMGWREKQQVDINVTNSVIRAPDVIDNIEDWQERYAPVN